MSADAQVPDVAPLPWPPTGAAMKLLASSNDKNMTTSSPQIESTKLRSLIGLLEKESIFSPLVRS